MSRTALPLHVGDISCFAKSLRSALDGLEKLPSHLEMLNILTKAQGYRNFQHFKAQTEALERFETPQPARPEPEVNYKLVHRVTRFFDEQHRLIRWPGKYSQRMLCLWVVWSHIPARSSFTEKEISELLNDWHLFGDHALLRRELVDNRMMERTPDGRCYKRLEVRPPADAVALLKQLRKQPY